MNKLYILVRNDLSPGQKGVQCCHAVAEFMFRHNDRMDVRDWAQHHKTMVVLLVKDYAQIEKWETICSAMEIPTAVFYESDMNHEPTAMAALPKDNIFKDLKLAN